MVSGCRDVAFIIPVYNEGKVIRRVIEAVQEHYTHVVCVNDGSRDNSAAEIASTGAYLVDHPVNMGQGAALQTGVEFARLIKEVDYFVTFDADGQHRLTDVEEMLKVARRGDIDIVLGSRFRGGAVNMPKLKRIILKAAVWFSNVTSGVKLTDTHNGLRVFNRKVAEEMQITMSDMSHASEIIELVSKHGWRYEEIPVVIEYTDYSLEKGQSMLNAVNIGFDTVLRKVGGQ